MPNRNKAEAFILQFMKDMEPTGYNEAQYKRIFADMSDKQFDTYMSAMREGKQFLVAFKPMYKAKGFSVENNIKVGKKYGLNFFERLVFSGNPNEPDHKTAIEFMVLDLPYRRQSQTLMKKISVPDNNKVIDQLTYQPTGPSKGSKISYPELQVLIGMGMTESIKELMQYRGGDRGGFNAYNSMVMRYGSVNMGSLAPYATGVESTKTVKTYLACMHISNTL
jgi:hypothetical protein